MKTIILGQNGPQVSAIGLGCMRMSTWNGSVGRDGDGISTIQAALDAGISFLKHRRFLWHGPQRNFGRASDSEKERTGVCERQIWGDAFSLRSFSGS